MSQLVYRNANPPGYRGFWGAVRFVIDPPKGPRREKGDLELGAYLERTYSANTPMGFAIKYRLKLRLEWVGDVPDGVNVLLNAMEVRDVLDAWESQILPRVMHDQFCAFHLAVFPEIPLMQISLYFWRADRSTGEPIVDRDPSGRKALDFANKLVRSEKWHFKNTSVTIVDASSHVIDKPDDGHFGQLRPYHFKRIEALDENDPLLPRQLKLALRYLRNLQALVSQIQADNLAREYALKRLRAGAIR